MFNPIALSTAKTLWSFGRSECNRVNYGVLAILSAIGLTGVLAVLSAIGLTMEFWPF